MTQSLRRHLDRLFRSAYKSLPLSTRTRLRLKGALFQAIGPVISGTTAYKAWRAHTMGASAPGRATGPHPSDGTGAWRRVAVEPSVDHVPDVALRPPERVRAKAVAFYLPQFHPIPENDRWWGTGFTEWRNVARAVPQFPGHYQPHLPADLGFYDLRVSDIQRQQVELARRYGLAAFCFYLYWFGGQRLLEMPLDSFLMHPELELEFCVCWANENWTRRWDGEDREVLMAQAYSEDDDVAFMAAAARYMADPRYLRIDGRPLLILYRPDLLPDAKATAQRWRHWSREHGLGELFLAYVQTYEKVDPARYGFDAAIEFPPNNTDATDLTDQRADMPETFAGRIFDWQDLSRRPLTQPAYPLFRGVCPSWDNEARRPGRGTVFANSNPAGYAQWLDRAITDTESRTSSPSQRLVFINAWNEWAEGAHLEPDVRYGHAWLAATRAALTGTVDNTRLVLVCHDAYAHGAQQLALALATSLAEDFRLQLAIVLLGPGPLREQFQRFGEVYDLSGSSTSAYHALFTQLGANGFRQALFNTTVTGKAIASASRAGLRCVVLIHEMPQVIRQYGLQAAAGAIAQYADQVVFPSLSCADAFAGFAQVPPERCTIRPQGLYRPNPWRFDRPGARRSVCRQLGIDEREAIVLGVGFADHRKGVDLFVEAALEALSGGLAANFVWLGNWEASMRARVDEMLARIPTRNRFHFPGFCDAPEPFYAAADVFALTSREDPFPSVILESLAVAVPVVAFDAAGGFTDLVSRGTGVLVAAGDTRAFAAAISALISDPATRERLGSNGAAIMDAEFGFRSYLFDLLDSLDLRRRRVSVVVPNFNYARYLRDRLGSILGQTHPIMELIVLDDASTDDSVERIRQLTRGLPMSVRLVANERNSGSVFAQWRKGVEIARGDFVWIAEADDLSSPNFLQTVLRGFDQPDVVLSYCESRQIDSEGRELAGSYADYVKDISTTRWQHAYIASGAEEVEQALSVKNTIPNVSAAVFRREALLSVLRDEYPSIASLRVAGDWATYLALLERGGSVAFHPDPMNLHRRHARGVTMSSFDTGQWLEIRSLQKLAADRFQISARAHARADAYAQTLYEQFGLASRRYPRFGDNPAMSDERA